MKKHLPVTVWMMALFGMTLTSCAFSTPAQRRIERISGLRLPDHMSEVFNFVDQTFTGVAGQYAVFSLSEETDLFSKEKEENEVLDESAINNLLSFLETSFAEVPLEYYPDFTLGYQALLGMESTYAFYYPNVLEIKVLMMGH